MKEIMMSKKKLVYPYEGYSDTGSDADYEQPITEKEFIKWLDENAPVDYEEVEYFSDEAGASIWIRFDLDKEEDDD